MSNSLVCSFHSYPIYHRYRMFLQWIFSFILYLKISDIWKRTLLLCVTLVWFDMDFTFVEFCKFVRLFLQNLNNWVDMNALEDHVAMAHFLNIQIRIGWCLETIWLTKWDDFKFLSFFNCRWYWFEATVYVCFLIWFLRYVDFLGIKNALVLGFILKVARVALDLWWFLRKTL